jgi:hypothetical protein
LSASAPSSHDLSLAAFTINIAESDFRNTQPGRARGSDEVLEMRVILSLKVHPRLAGCDEPNMPVDLLNYSGAGFILALDQPSFR